MNFYKTDKEIVFALAGLTYGTTKCSLSFIKEVSKQLGCRVKIICVTWDAQPNNLWTEALIEECSSEQYNQYISLEVIKYRMDDEEVFKYITTCFDKIGIKEDIKVGMYTNRLVKYFHYTFIMSKLGDKIYSYNPDCYLVKMRSALEFNTDPDSVSTLLNLFTDELYSKLKNRIPFYKKYSLDNLLLTNFSTFYSLGDKFFIITSLNFKKLFNLNNLVTFAEHTYKENFLKSKLYANTFFKSDDYTERSLSLILPELIRFTDINLITTSVDLDNIIRVLRYGHPYYIINNGKVYAKNKGDGTLSGSLPLYTTFTGRNNTYIKYLIDIV